MFSLIVSSGGGGNKGHGEDGKALKSGGGGTNSSTTGSLSSGTGDRQENAKKDSSEKDYEGVFLFNSLIRSISAEQTISLPNSASSANLDQLYSTKVSREELNHVFSVFNF